QGKLQRLDSALTLLRFSSLRLDERVRLAAALAYLKFMPPIGMEGKRAAPWVRKWMGAGPYRVLWGPLLRSKFGPLAEEIALPEWYRQKYDWGRAYGAHCLILALDRRLTDGYWMNVSDPDYPFMVLVEHTNYMPASDYGGRHLVYLGNYRAMDDPLMSADKE